MPPTPSIAAAEPSIRTSSTAMPRYVAFGRSPVMTCSQRAAACRKTACSDIVSPVSRSVMSNPPVVVVIVGGVRVME